MLCKVMYLSTDGIANWDLRKRSTLRMLTRLTILWVRERRWILINWYPSLQAKNAVPRTKLDFKEIEN
jgi:hypothetical protein